MIICGIKFTHDGAITVIENGKLAFCIELEKLNNNPRYTAIEDTELIPLVLEGNGYSLSDIDVFAVDGWGGTDQDALAIQPRLEIGEACNRLSVKNHGHQFKLNIAPYTERSLKDDVLEEWRFQDLRIADRSVEYSSYVHAAGHILSAYCTSPFAQRRESSYVLIWDGGMYPLMYFIDAQTKRIYNLGPIFLLIGNIYTIFSQHFGPFKVNGSFAKDDLSVAGKVMAYIALGNVRPDLFHYFEEIYRTCYDKPMGFANVFTNEFKKRLNGNIYSDEDILHTFHVYLEEMLIKKLGQKLQRTGARSRNLCFAGGCALNIKWNSAIRNSGLFDEVYTPPFPNDSGSAIGVACCAMYKGSGSVCLDWSVYSGPSISKNRPAPGWIQKPCSIKQLARLLHETNEPVIFLNGRAELGPRALGNRSIIATAISPQMKDILNTVKQRESYRPVSPICLEERALEIFEPGTREPYMLFDQRVKREWQQKIPAVIHLDGTARLQTISSEDNHLVWELLREYQALSAIPVLCNTSANFKGSGFFPDTYSATKWNQTNYVFCDNTLYEKEDKIEFPSRRDNE